MTKKQVYKHLENRHSLWERFNIDRLDIATKALSSIKEFNDPSIDGSNLSIAWQKVHKLKTIASIALHKIYNY